MFSEYGAYRLGNPGVGEEDILPLRHITVKVVEPGYAVFFDLTEDRIQLFEM